MKRYETVRVEQRQQTAIVCDGCGVAGDYLLMTEAVIAVGEGEEGGRRDEFDYCDDCLVNRASALAAAGSKAPLVTGVWETAEGAQ